MLKTIGNFILHRRPYWTHIYFAPRHLRSILHMYYLITNYKENWFNKREAGLPSYSLTLKALKRIFNWMIKRPRGCQLPIFLLPLTHAEFSINKLQFYYIWSWEQACSHTGMGMSWYFALFTIFRFLVLLYIYTSAVLMSFTVANCMNFFIFFIQFFFTFWRIKNFHFIYLLFIF